MYLHEFQAKILLKEKGIKVPVSYLIEKINQEKETLNEIISEKVVLKAQIHSGARGKAGGIKIINNNTNDINNEIKNLLNKTIKTSQTGDEGKKISYLLIEEFIETKNEYYLSLYIDRKIESTVLTIAQSGGMDIENNDTSKFLNLKIDLDYGIYDFQIRNIIFFLNINYAFFEKMKNLISNLLNIFKEKNLMLLEINPLIQHKNDFYCLDAKFEVDDNSQYKNQTLFNQYDYSQDNAIEKEAKKLNLNYISLNGNVGCIVNGAGLAMATLDLLSLNKINAANFLDIGGNATDETIKNAIKIIKLEKNVKNIFINIFGGIVKCDLIANIIIDEIKKEQTNMPIILRLAGNNSKIALSIIKNSKLNIIAEENLTTAIKILNEKIKGEK